MTLGMFRRVSAFASLLAWMLILVPAAIPDDAPEGYALYQVASASGGMGGRPQQPQEIVVDSEGGRIVAKLPFGASCTETLTFRWSFSRDIRYLRTGERFTMTLWANAEGNCDPRRNPYIKATQQFVSLGPTIRARMSEEDFSASALRIDGKLQRICAKPVKPPWGVHGRDSYTCAAITDSGATDRLWFGVYVEAFSSSGEAFTWQVAYVFRAVAGGRPTTQTIRYDNPGPNSKTSVGGDKDPIRTTVPPEVDPPSSIVPSSNVVPPSPGVRTLLAEERTVAEGQRVVVPVRLLNPDGVTNIDYSVTYDPTVVVTDGTVIKGSLLGGARMEANIAERGLIRIAFAQSDRLPTDGIVANLVFRAVGRPGDVTALGLAVTDIDDERGNTLSIQRVNGKIEIVGPDASMRGDCDYDNELTMADVICALQMAVGLMEVDLNVDVTRDGRVTSGDARQILQMIP